MPKIKKKILKKIAIPEVIVDEKGERIVPLTMKESAETTEAVKAKPPLEVAPKPFLPYSSSLAMRNEGTCVPKKTLRDNPEAKYFFGAHDKEQALIAKTAGTLELKDIGAPKFSLKDWYLIINDLDIISLEGKVGEVVYLPSKMSRGILTGPDGWRMDFCNIAKLTVLPEGKKAPAKKSDDHLFLVGAEENAKGWAITIESSKVLNLAEAGGCDIPVNPETYGMLLGPEGALLYFSQIKKIIVPTDTVKDKAKKG